MDCDFRTAPSDLLSSSAIMGIDTFRRYCCYNKNKASSNLSIGNAAYSNNLNTTRFRGFEYLINYDAGFVYADLTFTHMIGKNKFCAYRAWLGGVEHFGKDSGAGNWYVEDNEGANNYVNCDSGAVFSSSANLPGDRGSFTLGGRVFDRNRWWCCCAFYTRFSRALPANKSALFSRLA